MEEASLLPATTSSFYSADLDSLSDPPLLTIIQCLPWQDRVRLERVNRRWRHLCLNHGWIHLSHFDTRDYKGGEDVMEELLKRCGSRICSLKLRQVNRPINLLRHCPSLLHLTISDMELTAETVDFLCQRHCGLR